MRFAVFALTAAAAVAPPAWAAEPPLSAAAAPSYGSDASTGRGSCFRMTQVRNHRIAKPDTIYLRVGMRDVYKLTTKGSCAATAWPDDTLITRTAGASDLVCRPVDLDLKVRSGPGMVSPCIVDTLTKLTPEQVAALPPKVKP